jgi:hypothetical protein
MLIQNNLFDFNTKSIPKFTSSSSNTSFSVFPERTPIQIQTSKNETSIITSNLIYAYFNNIKIKSPVNISNEFSPQVTNYKHNLKTLFENNQAIIYALIPRTFNAKDSEIKNELIEGNEERGSFINAIERLDELKSYGINTLHILPSYKTGVQEAMGTAGSIYAVADFLSIDPNLDDPKNPMNVEEEFKTFVDECHKRGINVMMDIPGCAAIDLYEQRPDLMAKDERGIPEIPQGWQDIRMFQPWEDKDKRILNQALVDYHKQFISKLLDLGVDGFRVDVARAKPTEFWNEIIPFARSKNPECAFLAESYTYEDASPMANIPADRPEKLLKSGFDSYYGQYHIFNEWSKAKEFHDNMILNIKMTQHLPGKKSLIGSLATHDDKSPMSHGGVAYCNLTTGLQETLPMTNPYFVSGFESGDRYNYFYANKAAQTSLTSCHTYTAHPEKIDIFNFSRKPGGNNPEIGDYMNQMAKVRKEYEDIITKGSYIPLKTTNKDDRIIAYARHLNGKTLLIIANNDVNAAQEGSIKIPGLFFEQILNNLAPEYGAKSQIKPLKDEIECKLPPAKFMMFEIDTPNIETLVDSVYKQNNITN